LEARYDPEADAAYLRVRTHAGPAHTDVAEDGTILELDAETGDVLAYELHMVISRGLATYQTVPPVRPCNNKGM
jgi:uncharacterized protein YuzE